MPLRPLAVRSLAAALSLALVAAAPGTARALHASTSLPDAPAFVAGAARFSLGATVGQLSGTASELVFDYPRGERFKISELTWDLKEVTVAGLQGSVGFGGRWRVNLGFWSAVSEGSSSMIDRDWLYVEAIEAGLVPADAIGDDDWTHESRHEDVTLDQGLLLDLNLTVDAWRRGPFLVWGILGYQQDSLTWSARGGSYVYSVGRFRDTRGRFDDVEVIQYEQIHRIPYLGVGASWSTPAFTAEAHLLASTAVSAEDTDHHRLRDTVFSGSFSGGTFVGLGASANWVFAPPWYLRGSLESQSVSRIVGDVTMDSPDGQAKFKDGGGVALDATQIALEVGLRY